MHPFPHQYTVAAAARPDGDVPLSVPGARVIESAPPKEFDGPGNQWSPEQLLTAALSQCHMLSYLHLCAVAGVVVTEYTDDAYGTMTEATDGGGRFTEVVLRPRVTVTSADMIEAAASLHREARTRCFIANSVNFPVRHEPVTTADG